MTDPIMSRFDLFFVVVDKKDAERDEQIARHILRSHSEQQEMARNISERMQILSKILRLARLIKPVLSCEAMERLGEAYVDLRKNDAGASKRAQRITVRQLESLIRLSEARARLDLESVISVKHVNEAVTLLKSSISVLEQPDLELDPEEGGMPPTDARASSNQDNSTDDRMEDTADNKESNNPKTSELLQPESKKLKLD